jgi:hypothetical protein
MGAHADVDIAPVPSAVVAVVASAVLGAGDAVLALITLPVPASDRAGVGWIEAAGIDCIRHTVLVRIREACPLEALAMGADERATWTVI